MNNSDRHIAQSLSTLCDHMSTWTKLADDGFLVCNKLVTLHFGKRAAATDPDPVPIEKLLQLLEARETEMREWRDKLASLVQLLQSTYVRFVDALTTTRAMLIARQLQSSSAGDLRVADVIRIETLDSLLLDMSTMYATDLAAKLDLVSTLSSLVSDDSSAASPFGLPPPFPPEGKDRELLVRMLGHWMYGPAVRQAQVNEVREVTKVLSARVMAGARSR